MKKKDRILREILYRVYDKNEFFMTQKSLAQSCNVSLDTANQVVKKLSQFRAVEKKPLAFKVINPKKILLYWSSIRNLAADVVYATYSPSTAEEIEKDMPDDAVFTAYSGYRKKFNETVIYDEVFVYADPVEVKRRFGEKEARSKNIFVLRSDPDIKRVSSEGVVPTAQLYVDLWQIGTPLAEKLLINFDQKLKLKPVERFKNVAEEWREKLGK